MGGVVKLKPSVTDVMGPDRWLSRMSPELRAAVVERFQLREMRAREIVFQSGDAPDGLYGVVSGQVRLTLNFENGQSFLNYVADPGDWFGEISAFDLRPRVHDAVCAFPTQMVYLPQTAIDQLLHRIDFARALGALACHHHRCSISFSSRTLSQPVAAQIAYALLSLMKKRQHLEQSHVLPIRQEDVANMLGVSRQTVAPVLKKLENGNVVKLGYGSITVLDQPALVGLARRTND